MAMGHRIPFARTKARLCPVARLWSPCPVTWHFGGSPARRTPPLRRVLAPAPSDGRDPRTWLSRRALAALAARVLGPLALGPSSQASRSRARIRTTAATAPGATCDPFECRRTTCARRIRLQCLKPCSRCVPAPPDDDVEDFILVGDAGAKNGASTEAAAAAAGHRAQLSGFVPGQLPSSPPLLRAIGAPASTARTATPERRPSARPQVRRSCGRC